MGSEMCIRDRTVDDVQCISIAIMDDSNVLEGPESFQVMLTASDSSVTIPFSQESIIINVNEDPLDSRFMPLIILISCTYIMLVVSPSS